MGKRVVAGRSLVGKCWVWSGGSIHEGGGQHEGKAALPVFLPTLSYHSENHGHTHTQMSLFCGLYRVDPVVASDPPLVCSGC